jgi:hypothetical protein
MDGSRRRLFGSGVLYPDCDARAAGGNIAPRTICEASRA